MPETDYLRLEDKKELLRRIAMRMQTGQRSSVSPRPSSASRSDAATPSTLAAIAIHETDLETEVATWFRDRFKQTEFESIKSARLMIQQLRERNYILCLRGPRLYGFVHRTFLEYLTAAEYVARFKDEWTMTEAELLALYDEHCRDEDWREVLRLIAGQINEQIVGKVVETICSTVRTAGWNGLDAVPNMTLAMECLSETRTAQNIEEQCVRAIQVSAYFLGMSEGPATTREEVEFIDRLVSALDTCASVLPERARQVFLDDNPNRRYDLSLGIQRWTEVACAMRPERELAQLHASSAISGFRIGGIRMLARKWPDEFTRELLRGRDKLMNLNLTLGVGSRSEPRQ